MNRCELRNNQIVALRGEKYTKPFFLSVFKIYLLFINIYVYIYYSLYLNDYHYCNSELKPGKIKVDTLINIYIYLPNFMSVEFERNGV